MGNAIDYVILKTALDRERGAAKGLETLPHSFLERFGDYYAELWRSHEDLWKEDRFSYDTRLLQGELERANETASTLVKLRMRKLALLALDRVLEGVEPHMEHAIPEEEKLFSSLVSSLREFVLATGIELGRQPREPETGVSPILPVANDDSEDPILQESGLVLVVEEEEKEIQVQNSPDYIPPELLMAMSPQESLDAARPLDPPAQTSGQLRRPVGGSGSSQMTLVRFVGDLSEGIEVPHDGGSRAVFFASGDVAYLPTNVATPLIGARLVRPLSSLV